MASVREVAFELEAFEWSEDRLDVAGRWKGLTGRRLARPVLTVQLDSGRRKRVVAMPGGQLGATAESWHASFNWPGDPAEIIGAELELGRNVVVELPLPDRKRRRRRRHAVAEAQEQSSVTEELRLETGALRAQVDRLRAELAGRERELMDVREQLAGKPVPEQATMELRRIEEAAAEREDLAAERAGLAAEREDLAAELERLKAEHAQERAHWQEEIDELREGFAAAAEEAEQTKKRHAAELAAVRAEVAEAGIRRRLHGRHQARPAEDEVTDEATATTAEDEVTDEATATTAEETVTDDRETPATEDAATEAVPPPATAAGATEEAKPPPERLEAAGPATAPFAAIEAEPAGDDEGPERPPLQQQVQEQLEHLRARISDLWSGATNGHHPPPADDEPPALRDHAQRDGRARPRGRVGRRPAQRRRGVGAARRGRGRRPDPAHHLRAADHQPCVTSSGGRRSWSPPRWSSRRSAC